MKSVKLTLKGGLGNILKGIPLIKALMKQYRVFLKIEPDLPKNYYWQIMQLFNNWSNRDDRLQTKNVAQENTSYTLISPYMGTALSLSGKRIYWKDVGIVGESRLYLNLYSEDEPLMFSPTPLYSNHVYETLKDKYIISGLCKPLWKIKSYKYFYRIKELLSCYEIYDSKSDTLENIASMCKTSKGFIGIDSGLSNLAAAIGTTTFIIFGPTSMSKNKPAGDVISITKKIPCRPCQHMHGFSLEQCTQFNKTECLEIPPKKIVNIIKNHENRLFHYCI